jgi:hypothetical protein
MRSSEFTTEDVPDELLNAKFKNSQEIGDYLYTANIVHEGRHQYLVIKCYDGRKVVGEVYFSTQNGMYFTSQSTRVIPAYRNKGIASTMYAYVKMLGGDIKPSSYQLKPGKEMWKAWRKTGDDKHLAPEKER